MSQGSTSLHNTSTNPKNTARIVVLISGGGTNLQALIDAEHRGELDAQIVGVISNKAEAYGLVRAKMAGIETAVVPKRKEVQRSDYDRELSDVVAQFDPDLVVLAGFMRLLSSTFLNNHNVMNLHPALPGCFAGMNAIGRAYNAWKNNEVDQVGVMVHWVPDEGVDDGPVIDTEKIELPTAPKPRELTLEQFENRIHKAEHVLIVRGANKAIAQLAHVKSMLQSQEETHE